MKLNKKKNFYILIGVLVFEIINYNYIGFGFWNERLESICFYFPVLILVLIFINGLLSLEKENKLGMLQLIFSIGFLISIIFGSILFPARIYLFEKQNILHSEKNLKVELYSSDFKEKYKIMNKKRLFFILSKKNCIHSFGIFRKYMPEFSFDSKDKIMRVDDKQFKYDEMNFLNACP